MVLEFKFDMILPVFLFITILEHIIRFLFLDSLLLSLGLWRYTQSHELSLHLSMHFIYLLLSIA